MMADLGIAEIRAEARRLLDEYRRVTESPRDYYARLAAGSEWSKWVLAHADVLLADPAPVGLTEDERVTVDWLRDSGDPWDRRVLAIIDRLSAAPVDDRERVPEGWRVEWGEWDGDPIAGSGFTPRLVPLPVQGDEQ